VATGPDPTTNSYGPIPSTNELETWQKELDSVVTKFDSLAAKWNQNMRDWESVMIAAALHRRFDQITQILKQSETSPSVDQTTNRVYKVSVAVK